MLMDGGYPHSVPMVGGKLVLPGPFMDGKSLLEIMNAENCNKTCAVPTVMTFLHRLFRQRKSSNSLA